MLSYIVTIIDFLLGFFLLYSAYKGYKSGFFQSFYRLLFLLFCILLPLYLGLKFKGILYPNLIPSPYIAIIVIGIIFAILFRYFIKRIFLVLDSFLERLDLLWLNSFLGAFMGIIKAYVITFIFLSFIGALGSPTLMEPFKKSILANHMYKQVRTLTRFNLMGYLRNISLKDTIKKVEHGVNNTIEKIES